MSVARAAASAAARAALRRRPRAAPPCAAHLHRNERCELAEVVQAEALAAVAQHLLVKGERGRAGLARGRADARGDFGAQRAERLGVARRQRQRGDERAQAAAAGARARAAAQRLERQLQIGALLQRLQPPFFGLRVGQRRVGRARRRRARRHGRALRRLLGLLGALHLLAPVLFLHRLGRGGRRRRRRRSRRSGGSLAQRRVVVVVAAVAAAWRGGLGHRHRHRRKLHLKVVVIPARHGDRGKR